MTHLSKFSRKLQNFWWFQLLKYENLLLSLVRHCDWHFQELSTFLKTKQDDRLQIYRSIHNKKTLSCSSWCQKNRTDELQSQNPSNNKLQSHWDVDFNKLNESWWYYLSAHPVQSIYPTLLRIDSSWPVVCVCSQPCPTGGLPLHTDSASTHTSSIMSPHPAVFTH